MAQSESTLRNNEPAFVLHTYPYRETSLIVEALSRHAGRVALQIKHHLGQQELQTRQLLRDLQELRFNLASTSTTSPRFAASGRRCGASSAVGTILDIKAM